LMVFGLRLLIDNSRIEFDMRSIRFINVLRLC